MNHMGAEMLSNQTPRDNVIATRGALVTFLGRQLAPLLDRPQLMVELAEWTAALPLEDISACLNLHAHDTADALATRLARDTARRYPQDAAENLIASEYPRISPSERANLALFVQAARRIAIENDGVVTDRALVDAGFSVERQERHWPRARHLIAILNGARVGDYDLPADAPSPVERLIEAGTRSAIRLSFAA